MGCNSDPVGGCSQDLITAIRGIGNTIKNAVNLCCEETNSSLSNILSGISDVNNKLDYQIINCCGSSNQAPSANAGADQNKTVGDTATLNGGGSYDTDGTITGYLWLIISNPGSAILSTPTAGTTVVTGLNTAGTYTFSLTVTDNTGATSTDSVNIIVSEAVNQPPVSAPSSLIHSRGATCTTTKTILPSDFNYSDNEGDTVTFIEIVSRAGISEGDLTFNGISVVNNQVLQVSGSSWVGGDLISIPNDSNTVAYSTDFTFRVQTSNNLTYSNMTIFTLNIGSCTVPVSQLELENDVAGVLSCGGAYTIPSTVAGSAGQRTFTINNTGDAILNVTGLAFSGIDASAYSISPATPFTIPISGSQVVTINTNTTGAGGTTLDATLTVTSDSEINGSCTLILSQIVSAAASPPIPETAAVDFIRDLCSEVYSFTLSDFISNEGVPAGQVILRIDSLATNSCVVRLHSVAVNINDTITQAQIAAGNLTLTPDDSNTNAFSTTFNFSLSNDGGSTWV